MKLRGAVVALTALVVLALAAPAVCRHRPKRLQGEGAGRQAAPRAEAPGLRHHRGPAARRDRDRGDQAADREAPPSGDQRQAHPDRRGRSVTPGRGRAGGRRLDGVAPVRAHRRRAVGRGREPDRRTSRRSSSGSPAQPSGHREARDDRAHDQWRADLRDEGHEGRPQASRTARVPRSSTRPSSTRASGSPARPSRRTLRLFLDNYGEDGHGASEPTASPWRACRRRAHEAREHARAVVHPRREPRRLRLHVRRRRTGCGARTCATTTATGRSPPSTAWTRTATSRRTGTTTTRARTPSRRRRPTAARARPPSRRRRRSCRSWTACDFASNKNDHTFGRLLLWPPGWQVDTPLRGRADHDRARRRRREPGDSGLRPGRGRRALHHERRHERPHVRRRPRASPSPRRAPGGRHGQRLHLPGRRG